MCASSVTAFSPLELPAIPVAWGNSSQPQITLQIQTPRGEVASGADALPGPLQGGGEHFVHVAIRGAILFLAGTSESLLSSPLSPESCCLSWQELSILLPTDRCVQQLLSLAMSSL